MELKQIKELKKGEFFKRNCNGQPSAKVWIRGDYDRTTKTFCAYAFDDVNRFIFIHADKLVFVGFTF